MTGQDLPVPLLMRMGEAVLRCQGVLDAVRSPTLSSPRICPPAGSARRRPAPDAPARRTPPAWCGRSPRSPDWALSPISATSRRLSRSRPASCSARRHRHRRHRRDAGASSTALLALPARRCAPARRRCAAEPRRRARRRAPGRERAAVPRPSPTTRPAPGSCSPTCTTADCSTCPPRRAGAWSPASPCTPPRCPPGSAAAWPARPRRAAAEIRLLPGLLHRPAHLRQPQVRRLLRRSRRARPVLHNGGEPLLGVLGLQRRLAGH